MFFSLFAISMLAEGNILQNVHELIFLSQLLNACYSKNVSATNVTIIVVTVHVPRKKNFFCST